MNQGDPGLMLLRLSPGGTPGNGQAKAVTGTGMADEAGPQAEAAEAIAESDLFAGILKVLAQAGDTLGTPTQAGPEGSVAIIDDAHGEPLDSLLQLVSEAGIDLESVAGPFSLVQLPVLNQGEGQVRQVLSASVPESAAELFMMADARNGQTAQMRTVQGFENATVATATTIGEGSNSTVLSPQPVTIPNASQVAQTASSAPAMPAETPLRPGQAEWPTNFAARVVWLVEGGRERADLRLEPPNLGQLAVRVRLDGDQASLSFHSQHSMVREVVENALPRLRELMAEAGYTLSEVDIGTGDHQDSGAGGDAAGPAADTETTADAGTEDQDAVATATLAGDRLFDAYA